MTHAALPEDRSGVVDQEERELRERLQLALEATQLGVWDWDVAADTLSWDERCRAMFGLPDAGEVVSTAAVHHAIHPDDWPRVIASRRGAEAGTPVDVEFRVLWPDGTERLVLARGQVLRDDAGRPAQLIGVTLDVTDHQRETSQRAQDAARMAGLVAVAQELGETEDETEVLAVVTRHGAGVLGAQGVELCLTDREQRAVRTLATSFFPPQVRARVRALPFDFPLPMIDTAVTGEEHFLPDRAAADVLFPGAGELYAQISMEACAAVPLRSRGGVVGALVLAYRTPRAWRPADRELLNAFAAMTAQALQRIAARTGERAAAEVARMSQVLQRSMLTEPPEPDLVQIVVRYRPTSSTAQVGGDWYDAFLQPDGNTMVIIGDVVGHDSVAAAAMGQLRSMLRAIAVHTGDGPARVLLGTDELLRALMVETTATAVVVRLEQTAQERELGTTRLRWSNAGHLPPMVVAPDGAVVVLSSEDPDLLLGLDPGLPRQEQVIAVERGTTVLLYTDGLVERRGRSLQDGLDQLQATLADCAAGHPALDDLVDAVLGRLLGRDAEDDVALVAVRLHCQDQPRPPEAGPRRVPPTAPPDPSGATAAPP